MTSKETAIIAQLSAYCPSNTSVRYGIGDDAAVLAPQPQEQLVCQDMLMEGVHFLLEEHAPARIGHKALAVNLSDIAAMGGVALSATIALALPRSRLSRELIDELYRGFQNLAQSFDVAIVGGDTNIWNGPLVVSVTVIGRTHPKGAIKRSGAQVGDLIYVTGPLGDSYPSGHHLDFRPRLDEAKLLMDQLHLHSMIDVSDGLGKDLREIAQQSAVRAVLWPEKLPLRASLSSLPAEQARRRALADGEDFELCFTLSIEEAKRLEGLRTALPHLRCIGRIISGSGLAWERGPEVFEEISIHGYEHQL
jgi:thiamine-monophosphate kinase